jgi:hypothetical protein
MKKISVLTILAYTLFGSTACKKFLDINKDPNHPLSVNESLVLAPVEVTTATSVVGGFNGVNAAYWMQQLSLNQPAPDQESYRLLPADVDNTWSYYLYPNIFQNLRTLISQAEAAQHNQYVAIAQTLFAYNLAIATDVWNNIPYSEAFQIPQVMQPKYDSQESVYGAIQHLLDSALYYAGQPPSAVAPGSADYIYHGDMSQWKKFIYTLKARFYLRLSKAPGRTASVQADSALTALQNGFSSNSDNAVMTYPGTAQAESPWYQNTLPGAGGVVMGKAFIDSLIARNDPRLPVFATKGSGGNYAGRPAGAATVPDPAVYSQVNTFYAGSNAPLFLATYSEALFIKAEATFIKQGAAAADPIYKAAIASHMSLLGISSANQATYIASKPALTASNALEQIITEKYVAGFLSIEPYNDWRRTGYPHLALAQNAYTNYIPRRWPYPSGELLSNPQPDHQATTADRVWWDAQ